MRRSAILVSIILLIFPCLSAAGAAAINVPDKIRVVLTDDIASTELSVRGGYRIETIETGELLKEGRTFFNLDIAAERHGIRFGRDYFKIHGLHIIPEREPSIYLGKRLYRGSLQILKTEEGSLRAINIIGLEDYVRGVLYHEVSHRWPIETIKAQAIVSRTFALYQAEQNKKNYYYLKADTSSQVYGGVYAERYRTNTAAAETEGKVLIYKNKILPAFFHAACGGSTEDSSRLWKVKMAPLRGVRCGFCKNAPHFSWECSIGLEDIEQKLKKAAYPLSGIVSIEIKGRDASGRIMELLIKDRKKSVSITAKDLRNIIGPRLLKSTNFTVYLKGRSAVFRGYGWGHGVGMCQWGAFAMAKKGMKAEEILKHYYPGARVVTLDSKK